MFSLGEFDFEEVVKRSERDEFIDGFSLEDSGMEKCISFPKLPGIRRSIHVDSDDFVTRFEIDAHGQ